jgi:hypothetical protein
MILALAFERKAFSPAFASKAGDDGSITLNYWFSTAVLGFFGVASYIMITIKKYKTQFTTIEHI